MKKHTLLLIAFLTLIGVGHGFAQFRDFEDDNSNNNSNNNRRTVQRYRLIDHLRFGGDFGLGFASGTFTVQFSPQVGYYFNQYITAGIIATYEYYKYSSNYNSISSSVYGGGIYADSHPLDFLVVHAEAQAICYDNYWANYNDPDKKVDIPILIGGGYHRQITDRASFNFMLLWNLNATKGLENNTSFSNPIIRANITF
jgi:hypothetical protein